jgi:uncharacterized membrane protein YkoI
MASHTVSEKEEDHMILKKRIYWVFALVALLALAGAAVTMTSRLTSAEGPGPATSVTPCDQQDEADDAAEATKGEADTDNIEQQCGDQNEADDAAEATKGEADTDNVEQQDGDQNEADDVSEAEDSDAQAPSGTLDDGKDLLPQAGITVEQAIAAAQSAASGSVGEIDLEDYQGKLAFNVDVGDKDVKVDAADGSILAADSDD